MTFQTKKSLNVCNIITDAALLLELYLRTKTSCAIHIESKNKQT